MHGTRTAWFGLAAIGWSALGLAFLGRPAELRPSVPSPAIPPEPPSVAAAPPALAPVVTVHDPARARPGLNLITAGDAARVLLVDMDGRILHQWHRALADLVDAGTERKTGTWARARLLADGRLLVIVGGVGLVALDRDGEVLWKAAKAAHDDVDVLPDGRIAVLVRGPRPRQDLSRARVIVEDSVALLSPDGAELGTIPLVDALLASPFDDWRREPMGGNVLDTTAMAWLADGSVVLAMRRPGTLSILDPSARRIDWSRAPKGGAVSDLALASDGGLVVFETAPGTARSRVVDRAPETLEPRWSRDVRSASGGVVQRLPNGNTLVTPSDDGAAFELAPDGAVVWQLAPFPRASSSITPYEVERVPIERWP